MNPRWILALGGSDHDFSAALMHGDDIRVAVEEERLSRRKHGLSQWYENPVRRSVEYCLAAEGISLADVDLVVLNDLLPARTRADFRRTKAQEFTHHLCHAASAYMMLPHGATAGVLVYDGYGSVVGPALEEPLRNLRETFSFFVFSRTGPECIGRTTGLGFAEVDDFPVGVTNSAGMLYELVTASLGYDVMESGKTMGLASHGAPRYADRLERFVSYGTDVSSCFSCDTGSPALVRMLDEILEARQGSFAVKADLAASMQQVMQRTLLHGAGFFRGRKLDYFCVSGGCGLNAVANSALVDEGGLGVPIVIPPHCGDAGLALGALWLLRFGETGRPPELTFRGAPLDPSLARPGRLYGPEERRAAVQAFYPRLVDDASVSSALDLARVLSEGCVVGMHNGRSEIGPRALGGRSILADPQSVFARERINRTLKRREPYRPLAPMLLRRHYDDYFFDERHADAFMLKVARARPRCKSEAPAVVHVDGTARIQVVDDAGDPFLIELLSAFREATGRAILLNTSFNRRGEPIVETPLDAVDACLGLGLDGLYLDGEFYRPADRTSPSA